MYSVEEYMGRFNASALCLNNTLNQTEKEVNLMTQVNINGTYLLWSKMLKRNET